MPSTQTYRLVITTRNTQQSAAGANIVTAAHQLGLTGLQSCRTRRLFFIHGTLSPTDAQNLANQLLTDPVTESCDITSVNPADTPTMLPGSVLIDVTLLPGVTDPAAENLIKTAHKLGYHGLTQAASGQRYLLKGNLELQQWPQLASTILANPVIQRFSLNRPITPPFIPSADPQLIIETIPLRQADDTTLDQISQERRLALDTNEMRTIRDYFQKEDRDPTDAELEMLAQTWSEHCVHKTFRANITYTDPDGTQTIDGLLKQYIRAATDKVNKPWVRSAFVDNAGIVAFTDDHDLAFKVETHNHPSALEPFGGANTGVGGVVRDVIGVSARPIANTNILCFGPPDLGQDQLPAGVLHPRRIADGVIHGIEDYGNKMGIPTVNGAILYDQGYTANPLVYCGCLGLLPTGSHPTGAQAGDYIVGVGGRTGRDGIRGATFSSMEMDTSTSDIAGSSVQIGHPIQEKQVQEVILRARDEKLYSAITDCGAGGFSSAVGEMAEGLGAIVHLDRAPLKYPGLQPWEIWLSEAQERMVLSIPPQNWDRLQEIAAGQDVELVNLGTFQDSGRLQLFYNDETVGDIDIHFLHDGIPQRQLTAEWHPPAPQDHTPATPEPTFTDALLNLLGHPNIRSKEDTIRRYDHEVQTATALKPLVGVADHGPGDATVLVPLDTINPLRPAKAKGVALSNGICPQYGAQDPYAMAWAAIDEAFRNIVATGTDPDQVAILDNFCWGNPNLPDRLGALVRCSQGCYDAAVAYGAPFISGKDSLNNEYTGADGQKHAIPGTLLISAMGIVPDVNKTVSMAAKKAGNFLFAIGDTRAELGASHYGLIGGHYNAQQNQVPQPVKNAPARFRAIHQAIQQGLIQACHDPSEGGFAVAIAEMCLAGRIGAEISLGYAPAKPYMTDKVLFFAESLSRFIVEVRPEDVDALTELLGDIPHACIGVLGGEKLQMKGRFDKILLDLPITDIEQAWRGHLNAGQHITPQRPTPTSNTPTMLRKTPKVLILHANGTNRDRDAALACQLAGGQPEIVHMNQILNGDRHLSDYNMLVIPGGFSYGDDLGAGVLWAANIAHVLGEDMHTFVADGRPVLGICNGFQVLVKAGILPGHTWTPHVDDRPHRLVTLTYNESARFECRWVYLQPNSNSRSLFTQDLTDPILCPIAHGEGRLAVQDDDTAQALDTDGLIALTYTEADGSSASYPANPNGSTLDIAGICNPAGNVLGLMPHPENHIFSWQHPRRHHGEHGLSGLPLFINGIRHA